jgi:hypothetical protein
VPRPQRTCVLHLEGHVHQATPQADGLPHLHLWQQLVRGPVPGKAARAEALAAVVEVVVQQRPQLLAARASLYRVVPPLDLLPVLLPAAVVGGAEVALLHQPARVVGVDEVQPGLCSSREEG